MGSRSFILSEKLILLFQKHTKDKTCWRLSFQWRKLFSVANKNTVSPIPMRACLHTKQISVSSTIPRHEGPFWSVLFRLSTRSSKFSNEVLHAKFDLRYFVKEIFRWKGIWHGKSKVATKYDVKEWRKSSVWLSRKSMFCHWVKFSPI